MTMPSASENARLRLIEDNEIPSLPAGWDVRRFRFLFRESKERNGEAPVGNMLSVSEYRGVVPKEYEHEEQQRTDEELQTYRVVRPGQMAVNTMWLNHLGLGVSDYLGHVSPAYAVYDISPELNKRFVHHLFRSQYYLKIYLRYLYGIRPNSFQIKSDDWNSIPVIVPPGDTQRAIADFLDRETTRIDQLIKTKQRQIALLEEHFNSEIHKVISAGLDDTTPTKASGIQWFREIPLHWQLKPLRHVLLLQRGHDLPSDDRRDGLIPIVTSGGVSSKHDVAVADAPGIVTGRYGTIGKFYYIDQPYWPLNTTLYSKRIVEEPRYVWYLLQDMSHVFILNSSKSAVPGIDRNDLHSEYVPVPPKEEQKTAIIFLEGKRVRKERLSALILDSVEKLQELRSALITAAVTGQIDVTTWGKRGHTDRRLDEIQEAIGA